MKLFLEEYAQTLIAVLVAVAIMTFLGSVFITREKAPFESIEELYEGALVATNHHTAFQEEKRKGTPEIYLLAGKELAAGQRYPIASFLGTEESEQWEKIYVEECFKENFMIEPIHKYEDGQAFTIEAPGVYWLKVRLMSQSGKEYKRWIKLFVNGGTV